MIVHYNVKIYFFNIFGSKTNEKVVLFIEKGTDNPANYTEKMRNTAGRQLKRTPCDILDWL